MNTQYGNALTIIYSQPAAAKGDYIHGKRKVDLDSTAFTYFDKGIDILSKKANTWYDVMKSGDNNWNQHSKGAFQTKVWRALIYA